MFYKSTRSTDAASVSAAQAIKQGLANDGGLFVPESIPQLSEADLKSLCGMPYDRRAAKILSMFLSDYTEEELLEKENSNGVSGQISMEIAMEGAENTETNDVFEVTDAPEYEEPSAEDDVIIDD